MNPGSTLPVVILAMTMVGGLAVGGTYVTSQLAASARAAERSAELEPAAERLLLEEIAAWDSLARSEQPVGSSASLTGGSQAGGVRADAWITRLSETTYWLVAEASAGVRPKLRRRLGVLVRCAEGVAALVPLRAWSELP